MRRAGIVLLVGLAGCGSSGIEGTLQWEQPPVVSGRVLNGSIQNATSHSVSLEPKAMRLLDDRGRKVAAQIRVERPDLPAGESTNVRATWKSGKPVRIDYGAGTLALRSP
ncbi:MAG TPA: hypothetical protein VF066_00775 [Thermoleophilaceae bacterium]